MRFSYPALIFTAILATCSALAIPMRYPAHGSEGSNDVQPRDISDTQSTWLAARDDGYEIYARDLEFEPGLWKRKKEMNVGISKSAQKEYGKSKNQAGKNADIASVRAHADAHVPGAHSAEIIHKLHVGGSNANEPSHVSAHFFDKQGNHIQTSYKDANDKVKTVNTHHIYPEKKKN